MNAAGFPGTTCLATPERPSVDCAAQMKGSMSGVTLSPGKRRRPLCSWRRKHSIGSLSFTSWKFLRLRGRGQPGIQRAIRWRSGCLPVTLYRGDFAVRYPMRSKGGIFVRAPRGNHARCSRACRSRFDEPTCSERDGAVGRTGRPGWEPHRGRNRTWRPRASPRRTGARGRSRTGTRVRRVGQRETDETGSSKRCITVSSLPVSGRRRGGGREQRPSTHMAVPSSELARHVSLQPGRDDRDPTVRRSPGGGDRSEACRRPRTVKR
jgi:hypothetical protein